MTPAHKTILGALYGLEEAALQQQRLDSFFTPAEVAAALAADDPHRNDASWVRTVLEELWVRRKVLQIAPEGAEPRLVDVLLEGDDAIGDGPCGLPAEQHDARGNDGHPWERVALYDASVETRYRSRVAEIGRLLSRNHQRFRMLPSTGLLRYERRPQIRPSYVVDLMALRNRTVDGIRAGEVRLPALGGISEVHPLDVRVNRDALSRAVRAALDALLDLLMERAVPAKLAEFQEQSFIATLAGLYSSEYRRSRTGHIVTAGVGSGKSYSFQLGALVHAAYRAIHNETGIGILLIYPRVVLATNQFQELERLVERTAMRLGVPIAPPELDAGGRLGEQSAGSAPVKGQKFHSIRNVYQGSTSILISNLDTLANRIVHPEASAGLTGPLDLIVLDEVHLLSGLYGAHGAMLLKRLLLARRLWRLRWDDPSAALEDLLGATVDIPPPYILGASATIAQPREHLARVLGSTPEQILHVQVIEPEATGWVHHFFLRQRPEASSLTAAINATSCLVHNRRDGLHHEYYQRRGGGAPLRLDELPNPILPSSGVEPREPREIHKTLGFCDSLDGVNRWSDLLADNERTKAQSMSASANPIQSIPYFALFQEPLWRVVHHGDFSQKPPTWRSEAIRHYGSLCRDCKRGVRRTIPRIPSGLRQAQTDALERLWNHADPNNEESYLRRLNVLPDDLSSPFFAPIVQASTQATIGNLDACGFLRAGLCWWWSRDHLGNNHPKPPARNTPLHGYLQARPNNTGRHSPVNGIRVHSFTSKTGLDSDMESINEVFRGPAKSVFRHSEFGDDPENCSLVIGSPRIEVGVDLSRVREGVTFRAMRDPASLQQKVGRVGRELASDSVVVHIVTENARDHFYFRNPRIALDPDYLQPIPLHENNRIVAKNHLFMAIFDFLLLTGSGPASHRPAADGDRLMLINDHKNPKSFSGWDRKAAAVHDFFSGAHPRASVNLDNLRAYLRLLGAEPADIEAPGYVDRGPAGAPCSLPAGALDVFRHDFGPNFFLTPLPFRPSPLSLAQLAAWSNPPPTLAIPAPPRHLEFLRTYHTSDAPKRRSYLHNLLTLPLFRLGLPSAKVPGNQPFLWTPNLFESVGREYVPVFEEGNNRPAEFEPLTVVLSLLVPGTVTYRYDTTPSKVPVSQFGARGLDQRQRGLEDVLLAVSEPDYFEPTPCPPVRPDELPDDFPDRNQPVAVYKPRRVDLLPSWSEPIPHLEGLLCDNDERSLGSGPSLPPMPTPPRCFALRWYRLTPSASQQSAIPDRLQARYRAPTGAPPIPPAPRPPVLQLFGTLSFDGALEVTTFVWGLDRQFMTRTVEPARLVYRSADPQLYGPVVLGHHYPTTGLRFEVDLQTGSPLNGFLDAVLREVASPVHQALLGHTLHAFLQENARAPVNPNNPPWAEQARPSVFIVRNLRTILWFHLLEQWHPPSVANARPTAPPRFTLDDLVGCFTPGHSRYLDRNRFQRVSRWIASVQNPASTNDRADTLIGSYDYFLEACQRVANFDPTFVRRTAARLLLNSLGLAMHAAALRLSGAESENLSYFYQHRDQAPSEIVLFDSDEFGNGTCDLLRRNFHVSAIERVLVARETALGGSPDPLPTNDFVDCLEDALQECASSQASHLAFHGVGTSHGCWRDLDGQRLGERQIAGRVLDFVRGGLGLASFDDLVLLQWVPEFLAHVSQYPAHGPAPLVGTSAYPTFQALESAVGFCVDGCVSCIVAPEQNLHGVLTARETVSKLLLDALYRECVCTSADPMTLFTYPGSGPARTVDWSELGVTVASALGRTPTGLSSFAVTLNGSSGTSDVTVFPATTPGSWDRVFRPDWSPSAAPTPRVRPRMPL
ncbi:DEAD/DEAH box helicase [Sorangium sp. So ce124]|uniref:DEAD/DEAH box helicase family protein n=1 Tax=Sorangium sp. So ce124 TaxID=3133280 RepID=UPI003F61899B